MHLAGVPELAAVEEHPVEAGLGPERLVGQVQLVGGCLARVRLVQQVLLGGEDVVLVPDRPAEHVVALDLHLGGEAQQEQLVARRGGGGGGGFFFFFFFFCRERERERDWLR